MSCLPQPVAASALTSAERTARVRSLNDAFRRTFLGGRVVETSGVARLSEADRISLFLAVRRFDGFNPDNDPHGEHDFGAVEVGGERFFWKIDYYDRELQESSPDSADPNLTLRVLTLMRADEY